MALLQKYEQVNGLPTGWVLRSKASDAIGIFVARTAFVFAAVHGARN